MPTQPFIPNEAAALFDRQSAPESVDFEILLLGYQRTGVFSGCAITEDPITPDLTVDVAIGVVALNGSQIAVSAQLGNIITTGHATLGRVDLVSIDSSGSVVITDGTPAAIDVAEAPAVPADSIPLAFVTVPTTDTTIEDEQIGDKRVFLDAIHAKEEDASFTLDVADRIVNVTSASGARTVTLPDNAAFDGKEYLIHRDGANIVTVNRAGSDTFDTGATGIVLGADGDVLHIVSIGDGVWKIL